MRIQKRDCPLPGYSEQQELLRTSEDPKGHWSSSQSVAEATTCYWQKLDCRSVAFSAILLVAFALGTRLEAAESSWLPSQCSGKAVQQQLPYLFSFSQAVTGWASDWETLACFCPARGGLSLSLGTVRGVSLPRWGDEQLLFAKPGTWWELAKLVQERLCLLTILSSYCMFISVIFNPWLMPNQLLFLNFGCNCCPWRWKSLPWEKRKGTVIIIFKVCVYCWPFILVASVK